jgi:cell wall-associated NlpC family hydrolase
MGSGQPASAPLRRGDLIFWAGHVAIATDADRLIHANAHHMAGAIEPAEAALARIAGRGGGAPTGRGRIGYTKAQ